MHEVATGYGRARISFKDHNLDEYWVCIWFGCCALTWAPEGANYVYTYSCECACQPYGNDSEHMYECSHIAERGPAATTKKREKGVHSHMSCSADPTLECLTLDGEEA